MPGRPVPGHPEWEAEFCRTQGLPDDCWLIWWYVDGADCLIGIGDTFDEAVENAEWTTGQRRRDNDADSD